MSRSIYKARWGMRRLAGAAPIATDAEVEVITLNGNTSSGVYNLTQINGINLTSFDMVVGTLRNVGVTGGVGGITLQASPDSGSTLRAMTSCRTNNNTADSNWNRVGRNSYICLMGGGTPLQDCAFVIRNLNNSEVPTTVEFYNTTTQQYLGGGIYDDGTLGSYAEEAHDYLRFTIQNTSFAGADPTSGTLELTGYRGHRRQTTVLTLSASGDQTAWKIPANHTMGQVVYAVDISSSGYMQWRGRTAAGSPINGASDYSSGWAAKGWSYVRQQSAFNMLSGDPNQSSVSRTTNHDGFMNLWNLNTSAPVLIHGFNLNSNTDSRSGPTTCLVRQASPVTHMDFLTDSTQTMTGKIYIVTYRRTTEVTSTALSGTAPTITTTFGSGQRDGNCCHVFTSIDMATNTNGIAGFQFHNEGGAWTTGNVYANTQIYSVGDTTQNDNQHTELISSATDHGFGVAVWNSRQYDKNDNRGARPTWLGVSRHQDGVSIDGNGSKFISGDLASNDKPDDMRVTTAAGTATFSGTMYAVKYEMI